MTQKIAQRRRRQLHVYLPPSGIQEIVMTQANQQVIAATDLPALGQTLLGGTFAARYWLNGQERALILPADEFEGRWGEHGVEIAGASSYSDGYANTLAMAEAGCEIAKKALELDLHIPSCLEGQLLMAAKADGLVTLREDRFHWLSTQYSAYSAYYMGFVDGWLDYYGKHNERLVRPVRSRIIQ